MVPRKRPRQACNCNCQNETTDADIQQNQKQTSTFQRQHHHHAATAILLTDSTSPKQHRRIRRGGRGRLTTSWKMTMATFLLWLCENQNGQRAAFVSAWGSSSSFSYGNNNNNHNNSTVYTTKKGLQIVGSCSKEDFLVRAVYLLCDSPGAYYRGSSTYRDSTTCTYGDKARLQLEFEITDSFTGASSIRLEVESGIYDQWKRVAILDDLCSYAGSNLQRIYREYESISYCPTPGLYQLDTYYTVPAFTKDSELHYTPDVRFRFFNAKGKVLGCATTGTLALSHQARDHADKGLAALMAAFFALMCLFSSLIYMNYGRERRILSEKQKQKLRREQAMMTHRTLTNTPNVIADQEQRYHYFNGNDGEALNGSSDMSNTSNANSSMSSHPQRKPPTL